MRKHVYRFIPVLLSVVGIVSAQAQVQTNTPPKAVWKSSVAAGLTLTEGNSKSTQAALSADTDGKWGQSELSVGGDGTYGRSQAPGQTTASTTASLLHGFSQYNWLFGERVFGFGRVEGLHDGVADVKYRVSLNVGAGYYFVKNTNVDLCAEVGPGYVFQEQGTNSTSYAALRAGEKFHLALSDRARLWETLEVAPQVDKFDNYVANAEIGLEADLTKDKKLALRTCLTDTYNHEPAPGRLRNDLTWVTSIAYKF
jgi:putative salt-induced outer membrane protein YdiY